MTRRRYDPQGRPIIGAGAAVSQSIRDSIMESARDVAVTLDGRPARLVGGFDDWPRVAPIGRADLGAVYSWQAVRHVLASGGRFKI